MCKRKIIPDNSSRRRQLLPEYDKKTLRIVKKQWNDRSAVLLFEIVEYPHRPRDSVPKFGLHAGYSKTAERSTLVMRGIGNKPDVCAAIIAMDVAHMYTLCNVFRSEVAV